MIPVTVREKISAEDAERQRKTNELTHDIIAGCLRVLSVLGPGLLESAYEACCAFELRRRGHHVQTQVVLPVVYEGFRVDLGYRLDMVIDDEVVVELKAAEAVLAVHRAQVTSYLRLSGKRVGLLVNFNVVRLVDGITRIVNNF